MLVSVTVVAGLGTVQLATYSYAMQLMNLIVQFTMALGFGGEILVGHQVGAGRLHQAMLSENLELSVNMDHWMTPCGELADYVLPPKFLYEHADLTFGLEMSNLEVPYTQYTPAIAEPPSGSDLADEGYIAWALAKRLGVTLNYFGVDLDMEAPPSDDTFLSILARNGNVPFEELKRVAVVFLRSMFAAAAAISASSAVSLRNWSSLALAISCIRSLPAGNARIC